MPASLTIMTNAIAGGKDAAEADWIESFVIPGFTEAMKAEGVDVTVTFEPQGVDDEDYKTKLALDLSSGGGADIVGLDGIWVGEFAQAGYIKPLSGWPRDADSWDGWSQISEAVQNALSFEGKRYGVAQGADGRVVYYNKQLFAQAGISHRVAAPPPGTTSSRPSRTLKEELDGVVRSSSTRAPRWARPPRCRACCRSSWAPASPCGRTRWYGDTQGTRRAGAVQDDLRRRGAGRPDPAARRRPDATPPSRSSPRAGSRSCSRATTSGAR